MPVSLTPTYQMLQLTAWFLGFAELILAFYVFFFNAWHISNRCLSLLLLLITVNSFATSTMIGAVVYSQAVLPSILLAATTPAIQPGLILAAVAIFKPGWLTRGKHWLQWVLLSLFFLTTVLTLIDIIFKINLWYSGINPLSYHGGFLKVSEYTHGNLGNFLQILTGEICNLVLVGFLFYLAIFDREIKSLSRKLAWILAILTIASLSLIYVIGRRVLPEATILITSSLFAVLFTCAAFGQVISERRQPAGRLQFRLTSLILACSIPVIIAIALFIINTAGGILKDSAYFQLKDTAQSIKLNTSTWLSNNTEILKELSILPGIQSMDSKSQMSLLRAIAAAHPMLSYVKTVDWKGNTVASTDNDDLQNVRDQRWFQTLKNGAKISHQTRMVESSGQPLWIEAAPILDEFNQPVGAAIIASKIPLISNELLNSWAGKQISAYLIDPDNHVLAHSDPNYPVNSRDMSSDPVVSMFRTGINGSIYFVDGQGKSWLGDVERFDNGWGLVVQLPESDVLTPLLSFQKVAWIVLIAGLAIILLLSWVTIRQVVQPVQDLVQAATSASRGDLTTQARIKSEDELGQLAGIFNSMFVQLHETITDLETRLSRRNQELERQAAEMQTAAAIAREAASIHDLKNLLDQSTRLISERFGFYHVGVFLIDEANQYAILQSANSEGGQRMLASGYKLKVGQAGVVGTVADRGVYRIALDTGVDALFFSNPDLPATRSEIALPLSIRNHITGVLDVQSTEAEAFSQQDAGILQILADQIALAIENTRLIEESQKALHEIETLYGKETKEAWKQEMEGKTLAFHYSRLGLATTLTGNDGNPHSGGECSTQPDERNLLVPINLAGIELGLVHLSRGSDEQPWSTTERAFVEEAVSQVAQGLENARLVQEIQKHARQEEMLSRLSASFTRTLGLDALLKSAVNEISHLPGVAEVAIHVGMPDHPNVEEIRESNAS